MIKKLIVLVLLVIVACAVYFFGFRKQDTGIAKNYTNLTDYRTENEASEEIKVAKAKYDQLPTDFVGAKMITGNSADSHREIAITCDGMADRGVMEGLLEIFKKNDIKATFFLEGMNAEADAKLVAVIAKSGCTIGNYSYVGLTHGEQLSSDKLIEEICHSEKALKNTSGTEPKLLKLDNTVYNTTISRSAKVSGLDYLVKSSLFLPLDKITTAEEAENFVTRIKPGMIVSIKLGIPVGIKPEESKVDDVPAIDKKPGLKNGLDPAEIPNVIEAVTLFCKALQDSGYAVVPVSNFTDTAEVIN
jgi:peptidoglycan/xylan/chitin deacetylase (PgdA/CDA1 family)